MNSEEKEMKVEILNQNLENIKKFWEKTNFSKDRQNKEKTEVIPLSIMNVTIGDVTKKMQMIVKVEDGKYTFLGIDVENPEEKGFEELAVLIEQGFYTVGLERDLEEDSFLVEINELLEKCIVHYRNIPEKNEEENLKQLEEEPTKKQEEEKQEKEDEKEEKKKKKEEEDKDKVEDKKLVNLKGKIVPKESTRLSQQINKAYLYEILELDKNLEGILPKGVTMEDVERGTLSRVDTSELSSVTGKKNEQIDSFVIETAKGDVIELPEGILEPVPLNRGITLQDQTTHITNDEKVMHGLARESMYKLPDTNKYENYYISTALNPRTAEGKQIYFEQQDKRQQNTMDKEPTNTVATELQIEKNKQDDFQSPDIKRMLEMYDADEAQNMQDEHSKEGQKYTHVKDERGASDAEDVAHEVEENQEISYEYNKFDEIVDKCMKDDNVSSYMNRREVEELVENLQKQGLKDEEKIIDIVKGKALGYEDDRTLYNSGNPRDNRF